MRPENPGQHPFIGHCRKDPENLPEPEIKFPVGLSVKGCEPLVGYLGQVAGDPRIRSFFRVKSALLPHLLCDLGNSRSWKRAKQGKTSSMQFAAGGKINSL